MPRLARIVIGGVPHHVVQRGNNRQAVFFVDDDRRAYVRLLKEHAERCGVQVLGWCLMTNHVHLIARPEKGDALARCVGRTDFLYAQYVNRLHGRSGHLWEGRFHSCALDEEHFWTAMRYVEQNPVRARMERRPWGYAWSSAAAHVGLTDDDPVADLGAWRRMMDAEEWRQALSRRVAKEEMTFLRRHTERGWPLATDRAVAKFEKLIGRRLRPLRLGRPKGSKDKMQRRKRKTLNGKASLK